MVPTIQYSTSVLYKKRFSFNSLENINIVGTVAVLFGNKFICIRCLTSLQLRTALFSP